MTRTDFLREMTKIAIARQTRPLTDVELEVYWDELSIYDDAELTQAFAYVRTQQWHNFPTVGDFVLGIMPEWQAPAYNPWGSHEDHIERPRRPELYHARRKRADAQVALSQGAVWRLIESVKEPKADRMPDAAARLKQLRQDLEKKERSREAKNEEQRAEQIAERKRQLQEQAEFLRHSEQPEDAVNE